MKVSKSLLLTIILFVVALALLIVGVIGKNKMDAAWNDASKWTTDEKVKLPVQTNFNIMTKEENGMFTISIPFCVLYEVIEKSESQLEYHCAAIPYSTIELTKRFPEKVKLNKDIVLSLNLGQDVLPSSYLKHTLIDKSAISSTIGEPTPVTIEMAGTYEKPEKNVMSLIKHYQTVYKGGKESYQGMKVTSWQVNLVKQVQEYTETEKKQIISEWREKAWKDVNNVLKTSEYLNLPNEKELLDKMAPLMASRSVYCPNANTEGECRTAYIMNAATNIMYYSYAASGFDSKAGDKIAEALRNKVEPFVYLYNQELTKYYLNCNTDTECTYFHRLEAYDYPMCPINEIGTKEMTFAKSLFMDYRFVLMDSEYYDNPPSYQKIAAENAQYKKELVDSGIRRKFSKDAIPQIDKLCFFMLTGETALDQRSVDSLKDIYLTFVLSQLEISDEAFLNKSNRSNEDILFNLVLQSSKLNPYAYSFVPQPYTGFSRLLTGVQLQDTDSAPDGYWSSINATLILLYLTTPKK